MRDLPVTRIMTADPATIGPDDSAHAARELLAVETIHHLPVVDDGTLIGIVSSADLLKLFLLGDSPAAAKVRHIMQKDPVVLRSGDALHDAAVKLSAGGFHALPVVEPGMTLVGIVTSSDLIDHLLRQIPRGDGSLRSSSPRAERYGQLTENDIDEALDAAEQAVQRGAGSARLAEILLFFRDRNRQLRDVYQAAELYMRSGQGEKEHSVLIKRLADLRAAESATL